MRSHANLDDYQVAYLCGGPERLAVVGLVRLRQDGQIKISSARHRVEAVRPAPRGPIEAAVLEAIPGHGRVLGPTVEAVAHSAAVEEIGHTLRTERLLPDSRICALWQWRRLAARRRIRRHLANHPAPDGLRRVAALGSQGITDERLRRIFETPDPAPVKLPGKLPGFSGRDGGAPENQLVIDAFIAGNYGSGGYGL